MTAIPLPAPQAAAAAVAHAGQPPAGTVVSATGRTAHDQIRDERGLDSRRAAWSDGGQTAISGQPADTRPRRVVCARTAAAAQHPNRPGPSPQLTHPGPHRHQPPSTVLTSEPSPKAGTAHAPPRR